MTHKTENTAPEPKGKNEPASFDPSATLARIDRLEENHELLKDAIAFIKEANWVLLAVLFLGFVALIGSWIFGIIEISHSRTNTQIELIRSIDRLTNTVNIIESNLEKQSVGPIMQSELQQ